MKIAHIAPNAVYDDYWGFHENLLTKYHKKLGHEVMLIVSTAIHTPEGKGHTNECDYFLDDGIRVVRRKLKEYPIKQLNALCSKLSVFELLEEFQPDFIFFHGLCSITMTDCVRYKKLAESKSKKCNIVQDNHLDYNIGNSGKTLKQKLNRLYYRCYNKRNLPYLEKVYGVTPWRKQYAEDYYKIPQEMTDVLIMGADDDHLKFSERDAIRTRIREQYRINDSFLVVTGGKIDRKKNVLQLMEACEALDNVKLLIFGKIAEDIQTEFNDMLKNSDNIIYIGWIDSSKVYDYFFAADLACFTGQHSVLWEQACASKIPCVFKRWEGMEHVNNGGNSDFIDTIDLNTIKNKLSELLFTEKYMKMKKAALSEATDIYRYSIIAQKALECCPK